MAISNTSNETYQKKASKISLPQLIILYTEAGRRTFDLIESSSTNLATQLKRLQS